MNRFSIFFTSFFLLIVCSSIAFATTYYSKTGQANASTTSSWSLNSDGSGTTPANFTTGDIFIIQSGHTMTSPSGNWIISGLNSELQVNGTLNITGSVSAALLTVQQLKISITGILNINNGSTLIVNNGAGTYDLVVDGTLNNSSTISNGPIIYNSGATGQINGTYEHQVEGDTIPTFNWSSSSLCRVSGIFYAANLYGLNQNFNNFTYNCINAQVITNFNSQLTNVSGLFNIQSTGGAGSITLFNTNNAVLNVGEFSLTSGTLNFSPVGSGFVDTIRVTKNGGSFSQGGGSSITTQGGPGAFHFTNDNQYGSTIGTIGSGIGFRVSKYFTAMSGIATTASFVVDSGATLYMQGSTTISGTGSFNLKSGATLKIESNNGISSSGQTGPIQVDGLRTYNSGGSYEYSGSSAQNTGTGLPSSVRKLAIDNPFGVTLFNAVIINDTLTLKSGQFDIGAKLVTINGPVSSSGSGYFNSSSAGTVSYNFASSGQNVITNNSQYGNLTFNNFSKILDNNSLLISGTFTTGTAAHSVGVVNAIEFNGTGPQTIPPFNYAHLWITGTRGANYVTLSNSDIIYISGSFNPTATFSGGDYITIGTTIDFNGGNSQTIPPFYYNNLTISGARNSNDVIFSGVDVIYIYGSFNPTATFSGGDYVTIGSTIDFFGGNSQTIPPFHYDNLTISNARNSNDVIFSSVDTIFISGNFIPASTFNGGDYITTGATINFNGGNSQTIPPFRYNNLTIDGMRGPNNIILSAADTIYVSGNFNPNATFGGGDFITSGTTIEFNGFITQTIPAFHYYNLTISGARGANNVILSNIDTIFIVGVFDASATFSSGMFVAAGSTIEFDGGNGQMLPVLPNAIPYNNIVVNKNDAGLNVGGVITINGDLSLLQGNLYDNGFVLTVNGNILGNNGMHWSISGGKILLTSGALQHQISGVFLGKLEIDDVLGASTIGSPTITDLSLTNGIFTLNHALNISAVGSISATTGGLSSTNHVIFNGNGVVTGTVSFDTVQIYGAVDFGTGSTINGALWIQTGGSVATNPPTFANGSTLIYSTGGTFKRGLEWSSTSGPGYPHHVHLLDTTILNIGDYFGLSIALQTGGNVTIDAASELSMNVDGQEMMWPLTVNGNLINNGTVTLAGIYNGSLILKGDLENNGTLISNNRPVIFSGVANQLITRSTAGTVYFDSLVIDKSSNAVEVVNSPLVALLISKNLTLQNGLFKLNGTITDIAAYATITAVSGNFDTLSNDINFNGFNSISGTVDFQNIKLFGSVDFGTGSQLHKMMYLMSGGSVSTNPPLYLSGSTLSYHSGGTFYRGLEWSALSGPGYPYNVEINNNTLLNFGGLDQTLPTAIGGNLVVMGGCTFSMNEVGWEMSAPLMVYGSVQNYGSIVLSYLSGNDLNIQRDLFQSDAIFTTNNSIVSFFGTGNSTIDGIGTLDKLRMNKSSGTLTLGNNVVVNDSLFLNGGNINSGSFAVEMSNGSSIARTAGHVNGNLRKYIPTSASILETYEIGDSIVYSPVTVAFSNISANDFLTASTSISGPSLIGTNIDESKNVNRFWNLSAGAVTYDSFNATFTFEPTDIDSGANTNDFTLWRHNGSSWIDVVEGTRTTTSTQGVGIDGFQTFAIGQLNPFTITPTASAGGNISPNIVTEVPSGGNLTVNIIPDAGFHIDSVLVDGVSIGVAPSYDFVNVISGHTIDAFFSINTYSLTTNATNGTITKIPDLPLYDHGTIVDLQAISNYGYDFSGWSGDTTGIVNPLTLTMDTSKTIDANFVYSAPAAPQNLVAVAGDGAVSLHWNPNSEGDIVKYYLYAGTSIYPTVIVDSTIGGLNDTLKIIGGLTNYQQYYFRVTAADTNGYIGTYSDQVGAIPTDTTKPGVPQSLVVVAGDGEATIQWNGNSEGDFGKYYIYSGISPNTTTITDSTTSIVDTIKTYTGLTNYQQYYFRIAAMDTIGNLSSYSNEIMVMPYDQTGLPEPTSVQVIDSLQSNFTIQWITTTGSDFRAYLIYGGTTPSPEFLIDSTTSINDTSKVLSGLTTGTPYYFFVTAIDTNGNESGASNQVSATPYVNIMIIAKTHGSGTISPIDTMFVSPGNSLMYSYSPGNNFHFDSVLVDGIRNVDSLISYTFSNVVSDHTIDVYFSIDTYNLNVISAQGIVTKVPDSLQYSHGMEVQLTAVPNPGYSFFIWGGDTTTTNNPFTITVDAIKNVTAFYALNTYSLTTNAVNGTVLKTPDSSMYSYGMLVQLTAVPDSGYSFIGWSGDTVELNNPITVSMYNEKNITANFSLNVYQITASVLGDGTIVPPGISNVNFGDTVHYSFLPNTGSHFDSLVVNGLKIDSVNSFTFFSVTTAHSIIAYFSPNVIHHFIVEAGGGGTINPQTAGQTFTIRVTAVDSLENIVTSFAGNVWFSSTDTLMGVLGGNYSAQFIAGQHGPQIVALYGAGNNTISVIDSLSGKKGTSSPFVVNPSGLSHFVVKDTFGLDLLQQVQAFPFPIKIIASDTYGNVQSDYVGTVDVSVSGAVVSQGGGTTLNFTNGVLDSHVMEINTSGFFSITVNDIGQVKSGASNFFIVVPNTYSMNSSAVNGSIFPTGSTIADYGDTITFTYVPTIGYHIDSLLVDGIAKNDSTLQFTFVNITAAHTINAYFSINTYPIVSTATGNGSITPVGTSIVNHGDSILYIIQAATGHHIDSVLIDTPELLLAGNSDPSEFEYKKNRHSNSTNLRKGISSAMMDSSIIVRGTGNNDTLRTISFTNVITNHLIDAYFSINKYTITSTIIGIGAITPAGNSIVNYGDSIAYSIVPGQYNHIDSVLVDGINIGAQPTFVFKNIIVDHTITAYISVNLNIAPVFTVLLSDTAIARFDTLQFQYQAVDPDSGTIAFSLLNPPSGASIDSTGLLTFIPAANANGINYIVVQVRDDSLTFVNDTVKIRVNIYGDVSGNGGITAYDAALVLQNVVDTTVFTPLQKRIGDVSGNGGISALDASYLLQYSVGLISSFPGGLGKQQQVQAILSAFSFRIEKSKEPDQYDLYISVNKPSQVFGLSMALGYDSAIVIPNSFYKTALTDSMVMASKFFTDQVKIAMAGINPMNNAGDIIKFTFQLKDPNYPKNALLFTMKKFILNETDHTNEIGGITLNVRDLAQLPTVYKLEQNFPNPFNPTTTINYQLPDASSVKIVVYNMLGQEVKTLINEQQSTGYYSMLWNGLDNSNRKVSSGVYIYRIEAVGLQQKRFTDVKKMMLIK